MVAWFDGNFFDLQRSPISQSSLSCIWIDGRSCSSVLRTRTRRTQPLRSLLLCLGSRGKRLDDMYSWYCARDVLDCESTHHSRATGTPFHLGEYASVAKVLQVHHHAIERMLYAVRHGAVVSRPLGKAQGSRLSQELGRRTAVHSSCEKGNLWIVNYLGSSSIV